MIERLCRSFLDKSFAMAPLELVLCLIEGHDIGHALSHGQREVAGTLATWSIQSMQQSREVIMLGGALTSYPRLIHTSPRRCTTLLFAIGRGAQHHAVQHASSEIRRHVVATMSAASQQ
jgi:hypothetical protein